MKPGSDQLAVPTRIFGPELMSPTQGRCAYHSRQVSEEKAGDYPAELVNGGKLEPARRQRSQGAGFSPAIKSGSPPSSAATNYEEFSKRFALCENAPSVPVAQQQFARAQPDSFAGVHDASKLPGLRRWHACHPLADAPNARAEPQLSAPELSHSSAFCRLAQLRDERLVFPHDLVWFAVPAGALQFAP